eukprot:4858562-Heterocapsa_arctica.AAC.1
MHREAMCCWRSRACGCGDFRIWRWSVRYLLQKAAGCLWFCRLCRYVSRQQCWQTGGGVVNFVWHWVGHP